MAEEDRESVKALLEQMENSSMRRQSGAAVTNARCDLDDRRHDKTGNVSMAGRVAPS